MGKDRQVLVLKEVTKRLNKSGIDRVAISISSNGCENLFIVLDNYSHGKRMYFGRTDSWEVCQLFVAGLKSNDNVEEKIQAHARIKSSVMKDIAITKITKEKEHHRARKKSEKCKSRRKISKFAKANAVIKNSAANGRNKPNKLLPTASGQSKLCEKKPTQKRNKAEKCSNCGMHHAGECVDPLFPGKKGNNKKKRAELKIEKDDAKLLQMSDPACG